MRARLIIGSSLVVAAGVISAGVVVGCKSGGNTGGTGGTTSATTGNATTGSGTTTTTSTTNVTGTGTTTTTNTAATTGTNMCTDTSKLYPPTAKPPGSKNTLYCPFSAMGTTTSTSSTGGGTINCDPSMDHCCETPQSAMMPSYCAPPATPPATTCKTGEVDWACEDPTECPAANPVCCTNFGASVKQNMVGGVPCPNDYFGSKMTGTQCVATVAACTGAAMPGVVICSADAQCTAPQKCIGFTKAGNHVGACM